MTDIDTTTRQTTTGGGLLGDVSIPISSPMDSSFTATDAASKSKPVAAAEQEQQGGAVNGESNKQDQSASGGVAIPPATESKDAPLSTSNSTTAAAATAATEDTSPPVITRLDSVAIGPNTDDPASPVAAPAEAGPVLIITLLLTSGARHPYKIDERYLTKRNVTVPGLTEGGKKDPFSISVYTLKELILREWREEWEVAPSSPSSIRLIFFGRLLDDSSPLKGMSAHSSASLVVYMAALANVCLVRLADCRFNAEGANVVHMTVRPQDIVDDEEAAKGKSSGGNRGEGEDTAGCRCVIL